jgi:hypothetical protein
MGFSAFQDYMRTQKKSERTISNYTKYLEVFKNYLEEQNKNLNKAGPEDIKNFEQWGDKGLKKINLYIWAIKVYSEFKSNHEMEMTSLEILGSRYSSEYKLKEFIGVEPKTIHLLTMDGIKTVKQMLEAGNTKTKRRELAKKTGIPEETILELVKLSDLARIPGLKKVRARLFFDAGMDTLEKIAKYKPDELIKELKHFIKSTGFKGIAPVSKEANSTIANAQYLKKIVDY